MTAQPPTLLAAEADASRANAIRSAFAGTGWVLECAATLAEARACLAAAPVTLTIAGERLPDGPGTALVEAQAGGPGRPVVLLGDGGESAAVEAIKAGALDYVVATGQAIAALPRVAERALREWGHILDRRRVEADLLHVQKIETVGQLAGGVAHDFNNLLTVINGFCDLALARPSGDAAVREAMVAVRQAGDRAVGLTRQLLAFARKQVAEPRVVDLNDLIAGARRLLERAVGDGVRLVVDAVPDLGPVRIDPVQFEQVLLNLAVNARDAMAATGTLTLRTANEAGPDGPRVRLEVSDTGSGMTPEVLARAFEPFFSTKGQRGTGLGLASCQGIVHLAGGTIEAASRPGLGTTFTLRFPRSAAVPAAAGTAAMPDVRGGREVVLSVEDDPMVQHFVAEVLRRRGYEVLTASSGAEALDLLAGRPGGVPLMVTDILMCDMSGRDLAERVRRSAPGTRVLFATGLDPGAEPAAPGGGPPVLRKPFTADELARKVRELLDAPL
jgi:two-component system cell cycle sensor histidine kinase/response regulator CckA